MTDRITDAELRAIANPPEAFLAADASVEVKLKADSGYTASLSGRISPAQWGDINVVFDGGSTRQMLAAEVLDHRDGQAYRYIGKGGKPVLARDLEDDRDLWKAMADRLADALTQERRNSQHPDQLSDEALQAHATLSQKETA